MPPSATKTAAGVALVIEIAQALASPRRSAEDQSAMPICAKPAAKGAIK
jgi:hypothetical protein